MVRNSETKRSSLLTRSLRSFRKYHKYVGIVLALFLFISAVTGLLLGWKKDADWIQPPTQKGVEAGLANWMPLDELAAIAQEAFSEAHPEQNAAIDRLDVRPDKGIVKVLFLHGWWEVQLDGRQGTVLSIARRHSDWIEALHDGSLIGDRFKLVSMNLLGMGLVLMVLTGLWLWYGPKRVRKQRRGGR